MKKLTLLFTLFCLNLFAQNADTLKNETIIKLTQSKLGDNLIINKINSSPVKFDVSTDGLINLKKNNVSEPVITVMVEKQTKIDQAKEKSASKNSNGDDHTFTKSGIYFKEGNKYVMLDPTILTTKTQNGYASVKTISVLEGGEANYTIQANNTELYFNFSPANKDLNAMNTSNTSNSDYLEVLMGGYTGTNAAISPNEFKLVKLKVKRNNRQFQSGKMGVGGLTSTIKSSQIINFKYEQVSEHTYKVSLPAGLVPGQYCFVYASQKNPYVLSVGATQKAFDFGVR